MNQELAEECKILIKKSIKYNNETVLHYKIEYPRFWNPFRQEALDVINAWYRAQAKELQRKYETELYREAVEQYDYSMENRFPFHMFEAVSAYEVTKNENDILSLYYDHYTYTGGAHGNTVRASETWNTEDGSRIGLYSFTDDPVRYQTEILENIRAQIASQIESGEGMYFDDYSTLIVEYFNPKSFYLTPQETVVYYQQYEIAPYASGIPEFLITK